ncbi:MAG TPA: YciI family protein [Ignavibacteria bacterium]|nr:YciI family protein [Ignavibacteria bacterium]
MATFLYKIHPKKENFNETGSQEDFKIMGEHFLYLKNLMEKGVLFFAGPCLDASMGLAVFSAENLSEAQKILDNDPAVKNGVVKGEVKEFKLSLLNNDWQEK